MHEKMISLLEEWTKAFKESDNDWEPYQYFYYAIGELDKWKPEYIKIFDLYMEYYKKKWKETSKIPNPYQDSYGRNGPELIDKEIDLKSKFISELAKYSDEQIQKFYEYTYPRKRDIDWDFTSDEIENGLKNYKGEN